MDISRCNRYLVSASKDGKIIVWDWQNCKKVDEINDHTATINNVQFFTFANKLEQSEANDSTPIDEI